VPCSLLKQRYSVLPRAIQILNQTQNSTAGKIKFDRRPFFVTLSLSFKVHNAKLARKY
jgi:hypothetical protein